MQNPDFRYEGIIDGETGQPITHAPTTKTALGAPSTRNVAEPLMLAAQHAHRIEQTPVAEWRALLAAVPDELRPKTREMLERRWRAAKERHRRETVGKRSETGDREIEKLQAMTRRL